MEHERHRVRVRIEQVIAGECRRREAREAFFGAPSASAGHKEAVAGCLLRREFRARFVPERSYVTVKAPTLIERVDGDARRPTRCNSAPFYQCASRPDGIEAPCIEDWPDPAGPEFRKGYRRIAVLPHPLLKRCGVMIYQRAAPLL
jgi:hypothetical protein